MWRILEAAAERACCRVSQYIIYVITYNIIRRTGGQLSSRPFFLFFLLHELCTRARRQHLLYILHYTYIYRQWRLTRYIHYMDVYRYARERNNIIIRIYIVHMARVCTRFFVMLCVSIYKVYCVCRPAPSLYVRTQLSSFSGYFFPAAMTSREKRARKRNR